MSTQVQYRRGTETQNNSFTGALAEITVDTTNWTLRVHDGVTAGGQQVIVGTTATQALTNKSYSGTAVSVSGNVTGGNINTAGLITATGNITGGNVSTAGLITATGNITGGNVSTAGLITATGNITGGNINSAGQVSVVGNISGANLTLPSLSGNIIAHRGQFYGNIDVYGNLNATVGLVYANSGVFLGDAASGNGAAYAGVPGFTPLGSNVVMQFAGNVNSYSQLNFQNINNGTSASTDYIATADNGSDTTYYVDVGINSSTFNDPANYPGFGPNDSYVHNHGGNLILNPESAGKLIKFMVGGTANADVIATISNTQLSVTGAIVASGNITGGNVATGGLISATGNIAGGNLNTAGLISATGNITGSNLLTAGLISATGNITGGNVATGGLISATGNIAGGNLNTAGLISATGNITGGNLSAGTGTITVGGLSFNGNTITSSGSTLTIDPNSSGGNDGEVIIAGNLSVTGNVTYFNSNVVTINDKFINLANNAATSAAADGSGIGIGPIASEYATLTYNSTGNVWVISNGANVSGVVSATGNVTGSNLTTGGLISATGNITGGNVSTAGLITATGNVTGGNLIATANAIVGTDLLVGPGATTAGFTTSPIIVGKDTGATYVQVAIQNGTGTGSADYAAYANNGTEAGGWVDIGYTGNTFNDANYTVTGANDGYLFTQGNASFGGNLVIATGNVGTTKDIIFATGGFLTGNIKARLYNATGQFSVTGNIAGGNLTTGGAISATGAVTASSVVGGVMTGTSISVTGAVTGAAITGTSLTVSTGTITGGNIVNANGTGVGNIGSSTVAFNTVFAKATSAQYADLAETYAADAQYAPGTVLSFGGTNEVTLATESADSRIAGVVSTNPAHVMNADHAAEYPVVIALTGRVPTSVIGTVRKGDMMVSAGNGAAQACATPAMGTVIGKALENFNGTVGVIEVVVGRL